jgi:poly [ADP-ribose] polymerase
MGAGTRDVNKAIQDFEKKFKDKTKNNWADRANFQPVSGKYTLLEMDASGDGEETVTAVVKTVRKYLHKIKQKLNFNTFLLVYKEDGKVIDTLPSKLDPTTQSLIKLIYDTDMFKNAMKEFDIGNVSRFIITTNCIKFI